MAVAPTNPERECARGHVVVGEQDIQPMAVAPTNPERKCERVGVGEQKTQPIAVASTSPERECERELERKCVVMD